MPSRCSVQQRAMAAAPIVLPRLAEEERQVDSEPAGCQPPAETKGGGREPGKFVEHEHRRPVACPEHAMPDGAVRERRIELLESGEVGVRVRGGHDASKRMKNRRIADRALDGLARLPNRIVIGRAVQRNVVHHEPNVATLLETEAARPIGADRHQRTPERGAGTALVFRPPGMQPANRPLTTGGVA